MDETIVVTRSNKRANIYNVGIRNMVLGREEELTTGDMLLVVKNNYYWLEKESRSEKQKPNGEDVRVNTIASKMLSGASSRSVVSLSSSFSFIANGDRACVQRVRNVRELYGFKFADVWLQFPDYNNYEIQATIIIDTLTSEASALTHQQNEQLFDAVMEDYQDIPLKADRMKKYVKTCITMRCK